jgi:hypothetical protein
MHRKAESTMSEYHLALLKSYDNEVVLVCSSVLVANIRAKRKPA